MKKTSKILLTLLCAVLAAAFLLCFQTHEAGKMVTATLPLAGVQLKNELAEREMIKNFRHENSWLQEVRSKNQWVNNDVIKIPKQGTAPNVLINNSVYPIVSNRREDDYVTLSLNKYDTDNTIVTEDELYALPYEKVNDVQAQHRETLEDKTAAHAIYSISPVKDTPKTPILKTTGKDDGTGRNRLSTNDIINFKKALDKLSVPKKGRVLVLCSDHVADLLIEDRKFSIQYQNIQQGLISENYYGFKTYESLDIPQYDDDFEKLPFESLNTGRSASVCFYAPNLAKATGTVTRYMREASADPEYRQNTVGFRLWFICVAIKDEGLGAIVSDMV